MDPRTLTLDGNEAAARIAHKLSEVVAIYPITPASPMGEFADLWTAQNKPNLWGTIPHVTEMQSEGGAAGAVHGALQTGALATTFTASQGLLLMLPNMYKIAGELTPTVFHISARSLATSALSIFGDHSDVMSARTTGFAMIASGSVQEALDFAAISQVATLESRVPVLHFFDGFRTSHEVAKIVDIEDDDLRKLVDDELVRAHRARSLNPDTPVIRGTAMNPDVMFQAREAVNKYYDAFPAIFEKAAARFAEVIGRKYSLFDYVGAPDADRVVVLMGSGAQTAEETIEKLADSGEKVGMINVRLYRPFSAEHFVAALPETVRSIAVLDRTKEPGSLGEPLYQDVITALTETIGGNGRAMPRVIGGRYGISSKEFTPAMVKAVLDNAGSDMPRNHFTVGIHDDVTHTSLEYDADFKLEAPGVYQAVFFGLGSDGTVGANKNSIKIIGEGTDLNAQGYFVYDSKKSGSVTVSHVRFGPETIRSAYLVGEGEADFVACHQFNLIDRYDVLAYAKEGAVFLLNSPFGPDDIWDRLPREMQDQIVAKKLHFWVIDAYDIAREVGLGSRMNTIMQTCFFQIAEVIPAADAIGAIKTAIDKTYGNKGKKLVEQNFAAVDGAIAKLYEVPVGSTMTDRYRPPIVPADSPEFVRDVAGPQLAGQGDTLPVSMIPADGTFPTTTARWERRNIALEIPVWDPDVCIQCAKCAIACPHTSIRIKAYEPSCLESAPATFKSMDVRGKELPDGYKYTIQVAPEDCTGCGVCVHVCPARNKSETRLKAINMESQPPLREAEAENYQFFLDLPELDRRELRIDTVRGSQFLEPLFESSGACAGCGETPYVKLMSQLFGDRLMVANATGCSSIYCGNLPTTPWAKNSDGRGPTWCNSLFEDNAEFGLGYRMTVDKHREFAKELLQGMASQVGEDLARAIIEADDVDEAGIYDQRARVAELCTKLEAIDTPEAHSLKSLAGNLVRRSVWIVGGDGWAYDIGYGGLDHVLASGRNVNILVMDTEVYSNTGGQMSKATPRAAVAKFAAGGKPSAKKDLGLLAMAYGNVYVAQISMGANEKQTVQAFIEAERYDGPSIILAYSHCIAHGINMRTGPDMQKLAVESGHWPLYRHNPSLAAEGKNPLKLDSRKPKKTFEDFAYAQNRFRMLHKSHPDEARKLSELAQRDADERWHMYSQLAGMTIADTGSEE